MEIYEKLVGSILLVLGLAITGYSIYLGVNIFIKAQDPPEIFKPIEVAKSVDSASNQTNNTESSIINSLPKDLSKANPDDIAKAISNSVSPEAVRSMIPPEIFNYVPKFLNLSAFSIFLWVLILAGTKVSSLGIALIKAKSDIKL